MPSIRPSRQVITPSGKTVSFKKRWVFRIIAFTVSSVLALILAETAVRFVAPQSLILLRPDIWMPEEELGWKHRPNADTYVNTGEREVRWITDRQGFRIGSTPPTRQDVTFLALGDSFLEAIQVEYYDTAAAILERRLSRRSGRSVRILNTGVGAWNPNHYRIQLMRLLDDRSFDGVIVFVYLGNDIVDERVERYEPRQHAARHSFRIPSSFSWSDWKQAVFYPINDVLEVRSHLFVLMKNRSQFGLMRLGLTSHYFPETMLADAANSRAWRVTGELLEEISRLGRSRNLQTIFVLLPSITEVDPADAKRRAKAFGIPEDQIRFDQPHSLLGAELRSRNLIVIDTTDALRTAIAEQLPDTYGQVDQHLGRAGHQVLARVVEDEIWNAFSSVLQAE